MKRDNEVEGFGLGLVAPEAGPDLEVDASVEAKEGVMAGAVGDAGADRFQVFVLDLDDGPADGLAAGVGDDAVEVAAGALGAGCEGEEGSETYHQTALAEDEWLALGCVLGVQSCRCLGVFSSRAGPSR